MTSINRIGLAMCILAFAIALVIIGDAMGVVVHERVLSIVLGCIAVGLVFLVMDIEQ